MAQIPFQPIAVTGLSALFPQARTLDEFWRLILSGRDCMQDVPATHWLIEDYYDPTPRAATKTYAKKGAFLKEVPFDPMAYGLPPSTLAATDIAQLMALMLARSVLDDASGGQIAKLKLDRTSIILGVASATELISSMSGLLTRPMWIEGMRQAGIPEPQVQEAVQKITALFPQWTEDTFPGCLGNVVAGRVANRFNLGGTNCVTDAACASSLAALHMGIGELQLGTSDRVISGGVDALNSIFMFMCFSQTPAMSASGKCSPFARAADGTMMGEGGGMLCLRRLEDAERDGDAIHAVIRGVGSSSDGRAKSVYAPRPDGQAVALQRCYELAGYSPATVGLVEAHGTGTAAGDACEAAALKEVFSAAAPSDRRWCGLGSIKSQIGHTKGAAGTAGLIKAALALRHRVLPPTANVDAPNPALGLEDSPFYLNTQARPWIVAEGKPRRAAVSSFGFGGTNFHVTLEEYRGANVAPRVRTFGAEVFLAHADSAAAIASKLTAWGSATEETFVAAARDSQRSFDNSAAFRVGIVAATPSELAEKTAKLNAALQRGDVSIASKEGIFATGALPVRDIAYLFSGQGSQSVGMAAEVAMHFEPAMLAWEKFEAIAAADAMSIAALTYPAPALSSAERDEQEQRLRRTENAQPALAAVSLGYLAVLEAAGLKPAFTGGHSFGEIPALYAAGVIGWEDCVRISRQRGALMAQAAASAEGAMTAVLHHADDVATIANEHPGCVVANFNSPNQVVVAGTVAAIDAFEATLAQRNIAFRRLPVATGFHSPLVSNACAPFEQFLGGVAFVPATIPVFHNRSAEIYPTDPAAARKALARQLAEPVRFADQLRAMRDAGARVFVEVGPGTVLTGLARQTLGDDVIAVALNPSGVASDVGLLHALARLAVMGAPVSWDFLWEGYRPPAVREKQSAATLSVGGYNIGRPYPRRDGQKTPPVPVAAAAPAQLPAPATPVATTRPPVATTPVSPSLPASPAANLSRSSSPSRLKPSDSQDAIARAHETFLRTMADTHRAFLAAMSGESPAASAEPAARASEVGPDLRAGRSSTAPSANPPPARQTAQVQPMPAPRAVKPAASVAAVRRAEIETRAVEAGSGVPALPKATGAGSSSTRAADVIEVVMKTVAEKTGYPRDMLQPSMLLEGDLGIDSIKRVEILSAVQKQLPGLPAVDAKIMGSLQTLEAISEYLVEKLGGATAAVGADLRAALSSSAHAQTASANSAPTQGRPEIGPYLKASSIAAGDVIEVVMKTVAEKTGYPRDMLQPAMLLEGDLGIDSIKRVEILSAVQKQLPGLPAVDAKIMGSLQTLQAISDYLIEKLGGSAGEVGRGLRSAPSVETSAGVAGSGVSALPKAPTNSEQAVAAKLVQIAVNAAAKSDELPVRRYVLATQPALASGLATPGLLSAKKVVITDDGTGVANALRAELRDAGVSADVSSALPADADAVILLDGLNPARDANTEDTLLKQAFYQARAFAGHFTQHGGLLVTVQNTGGAFGIEGNVPAPWSGGLAGLAKTAAKEWPRATVRALDIERGSASAAQVAARLATELLTGGDEREIGLRANGTRVRPILVAQESVTAIASRLNEKSVVLATGGARGVTAATLIALARAHRPKFALLGRTELKSEPKEFQGATTAAELQAAAIAAEKAAGRTPAPKAIAALVSSITAQREIAATLAALRAAGSAAEYFSCDNSDAKAVNSAVAQARAKLGPVTALVHGAGVLADKLIADKTAEQFARVYDTKVAGLRALLAATERDPLDAIVLFSSVAGRFGNRGQADYATANEVLNKVAQSEFVRRGGKCLVRSINWGPWEGGMVTPELREHFRQQGIGVIRRELGAAALVRELSGPSDRNAIEVTIGAGRLDLGSADATSPVRRGELRVSAKRFPCLTSHVVKGRAVVPIALAVEWLLGAGQAARPQSALHQLRDLQVLKPLVLERERDEIFLEISTRELDANRVAVTIGAPGAKQPNYQAIADFSPVATLTTAPFPRANSWQPFSFDVAGVYDGRLFHGPDFQVVTDLRGCSKTGAELRIANIAKVDSLWRIGPAVFDGALQAATLWTLENSGKSSLPMRIAEVVVSRSARVDETCTCRVRGQSQASNSVSDVECLDDEGAMVFALRGVECFHIDSYWTAVKA